MWDATESAWTHSPRAGWLPVPSWAKLNAALGGFNRVSAGFVRLSTESFSPQHHTLRRQSSFNLWEQLALLRGWHSRLHSAVPWLASAFLSRSHRLISSFPSQHRAIKLGVWFQVETQGHMLKESHSGAGISGWHSNPSPSQEAPGRGLRLSAFPGAQQTPSGVSSVWLLWFRVWQLWLQGHQPALSSSSAELGERSQGVAGNLLIICSSSQFLSYAADFSFFLFCSVAHGTMVIKGSICSL